MKTLHLFAVLFLFVTPTVAIAADAKLDVCRELRPLLVQAYKENKGDYKRLAEFFSPLYITYSAMGCGLYETALGSVYTDLNK